VTVIGVDDTDSRTGGMCTTYIAHLVGERLRTRYGDGIVDRFLLIRLNPAVEHKTRGNAALAVHTDVDPVAAFATARSVVEDTAVVADDRTEPGVVVASGDPLDVPDAVADFAREAVRDHHRVEDAVSVATAAGYHHAGYGGPNGPAVSGTDDDGGTPGGRGRIGALAAVGAWRAFGGTDGDWTFEHIAYREADRRGTSRTVDDDSVFEAAKWGYPTVWDTVDRVEGETVCVPHTPGPILYGIRGDDPEACRAVAGRIDAEPVVTSETFVTNQGTDAHLRDGRVGDVCNDRSYRVTGTVRTAPETRRGGHVFCSLGVFDPEEDDDPQTLALAAFEPTKRFRDRVRALEPGDRVTACGEISDGTLKLEKFAVRELNRTELAVPTCPDCGRSMESAGADQGYRCRDCDTIADGKVERTVDRDLEPGWYEVPPVARRHVAKPLVRGGFDASTHPER
jgi:tRNA(Ile2)-agmatinylcytidine synthase